MENLVSMNLKFSNKYYFSTFPSWGFFHTDEQSINKYMPKQNGANLYKREAGDGII